MASIFTMIIRGEIPCEKITETDSEIAFLDINPCSHGHTLCIPKREVARLEELPLEEAASLMGFMQRVSAAVSRAFDGTDYNLTLNNGVNAGQEVPHVHFHVIPRKPGSSRPFKSREPYGEGEMAAVGERIRACLD